MKAQTFIVLYLRLQLIFVVKSTLKRYKIFLRFLRFLRFTIKTLDVDVVAFVDPRIIHRHLKTLSMSEYRSADRCHFVSLQRHVRHGNGGVGVALCAVH